MRMVFYDGFLFLHHRLGDWRTSAHTRYHQVTEFCLHWDSFFYLFIWAYSICYHEEGLLDTYGMRRTV